MIKRTAIPSISAEGGLSRYLEAIKHFPMLEPQEELALAYAHRDQADQAAGDRLVTSHLRLAAKIAMGYRYYGLPIADLISEANVGLLRAVAKFEPERGFRLATYAMWWIKASINEYVLASWSLVKVGTIAAQKKLFFNLRKIKARLGYYEEGDLSALQASTIADELHVDVVEVHNMNRRMSRQDTSLDVPIGEDGQLSRLDLLVDDRVSQEEALGEREERALGSRLLAEALGTLNDRERHIIVERRLRNAPITLEDLGQQYGISRERVRQIENRAFSKIQQAVRKALCLLDPGRGFPLLDR